jgi:hypothetical protein
MIWRSASSRFDQLQLLVIAGIGGGAAWRFDLSKLAI